ncbi:MAG: hypothetical protein V1489_02890 [Candidatus Liptonbacteria bacterium]
MRKKYTYISLGVLALLIVAIVWLWMARSSEQAVNNPVNTSGENQQSAPLALPPLEGLRPEEIPPGDTIVLQTSAGSVTIPNFYRDAKRGEEGSIVLKATADHFISYDPASGTFWVAITADPVDAIRPQAEKDFMTILKLSQGDACKLSVIVGPAYRGPDKPAQFSPLSFCAANQ